MHQMSLPTDPTIYTLVMASVEEHLTCGGPATTHDCDIDDHHQLQSLWQ